MKITRLELTNFKYFSHLKIQDISADAEVVLLVGPNGTGKSCVFDAFHHHAYPSKYNSMPSDDEYYKKDPSLEVSVKIFDENNRLLVPPTQQGREVSFYGRSSYRFTSRISRSEITTRVANQVLHDQDAPRTYAELDQRIENDIEKALGELIQLVQAQDGKSNIDIVNTVVGSVNQSLSSVFPESQLQLKRIIDPHSDPVAGKIDLEFMKNRSTFSFRNLSSGEKEVFDIIFNFHRRKESWIRNGVYFIDEPELHLNTKIQAGLFNELHRLCKEVNAQLWVATHSLGFLSAAQDLKRSNPSSVAVLEFSADYADRTDPIKPIRGTRDEWKKIFQTALEDITGLVAPKRIIYCEGTITRSLDESLLNQIFSDRDESLFIAASSKDLSIKYAEIALTILNKAFEGVEIRNLVDRDTDTGNSVKNSSVTICRLERREFENYLYDFEIVSKAFPTVMKDAYDQVVADPINDDVDSRVIQLIALTGRSMSEKDFKKALTTQITEDTQIYKDLERIIFV